MTTTHHAVLWMDHNEARLIALAPEGAAFQELAHVRAHDTHTHSKKAGGHRHPIDAHFLADVERVLAGCEAVALFGPSHAKDELVHHLEATKSPLRGRVVSVVALDRVTDGELAARGRDVFSKTDRMHGVHVGKG